MICDNCFIKYDKSKGDYIYNNKHFHSKKCFDDYVKNNFEKEEKMNSDMNIYNSSDNNVTDNIYDPMNDF